MDTPQFYTFSPQLLAMLEAQRLYLEKRSEEESQKKTQKKFDEEFDEEKNAKLLALRAADEDKQRIAEFEATRDFEDEAEKFFAPPLTDLEMLGFEGPAKELLGRIKSSDSYLIYFEQKIHKMPVMRSTLGQLAFALPATYEQLVNLISSDPSWNHVLTSRSLVDLVNICLVVRSLARDPKYKNHPFFTTVHWVEHVAGSEFNSKVDMQPFERDAKCTLGKASIWTLCKWFCAQLRAAVNNCFDVRGKPFIKGRYLGSMSDNSDSRPTLWTEKAHWKYLPQSDPLTVQAREILSQLKGSYNMMLHTSPDLSHEFHLRNNAMKKQIKNVDSSDLTVPMTPSPTEVSKMPNAPKLSRKQSNANAHGPVIAYNGKLF
jgi:hypothetical protein